MKHTKYPELKEEQKILAKEIKNAKYHRDHFLELNEHQGPWTYEVQTLAEQFRHNHIAYCMLRGRKYEEIERVTRPNNKPDMSLVKAIMESYKVEETLCLSA